MVNWLPAFSEFFPPTPKALTACQTFFKSFPLISIAQWLAPPTPMGRTSLNSWLNLPGRYGWSAAEMVGPLNLIYIMYSLPSKLPPLGSTTTSHTPATGLFGTGLPITHEILGLLYVLHYINRAGVTPLIKAPSMSPIWAPVAFLMAVFQFTNSSSIGGWICYDAQRRAGTLRADNDQIDAALISPLSILGMVMFIVGLAGNITAEWHLFELRRGAAKRKAKSEGKAVVTYDKVYVIPEARGMFKHVMFPYYALEWIEWTGYWILGGAWGLGWSWFVSAPLMFLVNELATMTPRAVDGLKWYEKKFGKRSLAGRKAVIPGVL